MWDKLPFSNSWGVTHTHKKSKKIHEMEATIRNHIIGQHKAVESVSRALLRARVGLRDPKRPIASFIFTGSTGVGKTELANAVAIEYFGSIENMIRLDMSEFAAKFSASRLYGAPPGYVGYDEGSQLTTPIAKKPDSVILFDEIEKAHPDVYDGLLQILEDGRLTEGTGNTFDFSQAIIIMTTNLAHDLFSEARCPNEEEYQRLKKQVVKELKKFFRPELLNRLDDVILFDQLNRNDLGKILEIMLSKVYKRLQEKYNIIVVTKDSVKDKLIEEGYDPVNGARPLRRCIIRVLEDPLAQWIADEQIKKNDSIVVDLDALGNLIYSQVARPSSSENPNVTPEAPASNDKRPCEDAARNEACEDAARNDKRARLVDVHQSGIMKPSNYCI